MRAQLTQLPAYVAAAVADDYESFDLVVETVVKLLAQDGLSTEGAAILDTLEELVASGYVKAYALPATTEVPFTRDRLKELWFYATHEGKRLANKRAEDVPN